MKDPLTFSLYRACKLVIKLMEEGKLVRDISGDNKPDWGIEVLRLVRDLQTIQTAVAHAEAEGYREETVEP